jgi:hypothetical protein
MDIKDLGREGVNWFHLAQNRASGELLWTGWSIHL